MKRKPNPPAQQEVPTYPTAGLAKVSEAARFLSVVDETIYNMIHSGELKFVTVRSAMRIPWEELHAIVASAKRKKRSE